MLQLELHSFENDHWTRIGWGKNSLKAYFSIVSSDETGDRQKTKITINK
jgi:hypothetical protein